MSFICLGLLLISGALLMLVIAQMVEEHHERQILDRRLKDWMREVEERHVQKR